MSDVFDNYEIDATTLHTETNPPHLIVSVLSSIGSIILNSFLMMFLITIVLNFEFNEISIVVAIGMGVGIFITGFFGGMLWEWMGKLIAKSFYVAYLPEVKNNFISKFYRKFIDNDAQIFMEARANDDRVNGPTSIFKLIFRISISQLAFYITVTTFILDPILGNRIKIRDAIQFYADYGDMIDIFLAMGVGVFLLGLYLPMSFIMDDSNLRTFDTGERVLDTPGSTLRSYIDGIAGLGALTSGWSIFGPLRETATSVFTRETGYFIFGGSETIFVALDYISWLIIIMVISWPLIFPATLFFFNRYRKIINSFRADAIKDGIKIGVTRVRPPESSEEQVIQSYISK